MKILTIIERLTSPTSSERITLEELKAWLKVEHNLDDLILDNLKDAAVNEAFNYTQNDFREYNELGELVQMPIPFNFKLACYMLVAYLYENRGDLENTLPHNSRNLLEPYKKLVGL